MGYPEGWPKLAKYGTLQLSDDSLYANIITISKAHSQQERDRLFEVTPEPPASNTLTNTLTNTLVPCTLRGYCLQQLGFEVTRGAARI